MNIDFLTENVIQTFSSLKIVTVVDKQSVFIWDTPEVSLKVAYLLQTIPK